MKVCVAQIRHRSSVREETAKDEKQFSQLENHTTSNLRYSWSLGYFVANYTHIHEQMHTHAQDVLCGLAIRTHYCTLICIIIAVIFIIVSHLHSSSSDSYSTSDRWTVTFALVSNYLNSTEIKEVFNGRLIIVTSWKTLRNLNIVLMKPNRWLKLTSKMLYWYLNAIKCLCLFTPMVVFVHISPTLGQNCF